MGEPYRSEVLTADDRALLKRWGFKATMRDARNRRTVLIGRLQREMNARAKPQERIIVDGLWGHMSDHLYKNLTRVGHTFDGFLSELEVANAIVKWREEHDA